MSERPALASPAESDLQAVIENSATIALMEAVGYPPFDPDELSSNTERKDSQHD